MRRREGAHALTLSVTETTVRRRATARAVVLFSAAAVCLASLIWLRHVRAGTGDLSATDPSTYWDDAERRAVQAIVETRYVDPLDAAAERRLFDASLRGYVGALDPYSRYIPAADRPALDQETKGAFGGIGVLISAVPGGLRVTGVRDDGPAARAGILPGELLESADGVPLTGRDLDELLHSIKGPIGTEVRIVVRDAAGAARAVDVARAEVALDTVPVVRLLPGAPNIGYLRIEQFADSTVVDAREAMARLREGGAAAYILDLRQNLGGTVRAAEAVASMFLAPKTTVLVTRRRDGGEVHVTAADPQAPPDTVSPLVVLVDEGSASASEILAGALQDHGRGVLLGERTYGKFYVQSLVPVSDGESVVSLTTSRYETPRGRAVQRDSPSSPAADALRVLGGLLPDVRVVLPSREEREMLRLAFASQSGLHWHTVPRPADAFVDRQLATAVALLRGARAPEEPVGRRL